MLNILKTIVRKSNFKIRKETLSYTHKSANNNGCDIKKEPKELHKPVLLHEVLSYLVKETPHFKVFINS